MGPECGSYLKLSLALAQRAVGKGPPTGLWRRQMVCAALCPQWLRVPLALGRAFCPICPHLCSGMLQYIDTLHVGSGQWNLSIYCHTVWVP